jgi:hypothetical protein
MKIISLFFITLTFLTIQSCLNDDEKSNEIKPLKISGKVFGLSDSIDENKCTQIPIGTDNNWPTYIFINDSIFIKTIDNCCDPSTISHYSGTYKIQRDKLFLLFDTLQVCYYSENMTDSLGQIIEGQNIHIELETSNFDFDSLQIYSCKTNPYFIEVHEPWQGKNLAFSEHSIDKYINQIKKLNVWDKLQRTN